MSNLKIDRREALRSGFGGALGLGALGLLNSTSWARPQGGPKSKVLLIFLRGGYDAINTVIPFGDPDDNIHQRPSIMLPDPATDPTATVEIDPGNDFVRLHPALADLQPMLTAGDIVFLHQTGNTFRTGSHFEDQRMWETGIPGSAVPTGFDKEEGWVPRLTSGHMASNPFPAASVSTSFQQLFRSSEKERILAHIKQITNSADTSRLYTMVSSQPTLDGKVLGVFNPGSGDVYGLTSEYYLSSFDSNPDLAFAGTLGERMLQSATAVDNLPATYLPLGGANYSPTTGSGFQPLFNRNLRDAMWLLRHDPNANIVGVELGGFDTHSNQGSGTGRLADRLSALAAGLRNVYLDGSADPKLDLTTIVMSEFGRTSADNNSGGTDHGGASCMWVMGSRVQARTLPVTSSLPGSHTLVYNCDDVLWPAGRMFSARGGDVLGTSCSPPPINAKPTNGECRFVAPLTDFRSVLGEAMKKIFGLNDTDMDAILPGYSGGPNAGELGFMV